MKLRRPSKWRKAYHLVTNFHQACKDNNTDVIRQINLLLSTGKRVKLLSSRVTDQSETALHMAVRCAAESTVRYLIHGFLPRESMLKVMKMKDVIGRTPLHLSMDNNNDGACMIMVRFLKDALCTHKKG